MENKFGISKRDSVNGAGEWGPVAYGRSPDPAPDEKRLRTVWDAATPDEAARVTLTVYGERAPFVALSRALNRLIRGKPDDYRFWVAVFYQILSSRKELRRWRDKKQSR